MEKGRVWRLATTTTAGHLETTATHISAGRDPG